MPVIITTMFAIVHFIASFSYSIIKKYIDGIFNNPTGSEVILFILYVFLFFFLSYLLIFLLFQSKRAKYFYNRWLGDYFTYRLIVFIYAACVFTYLLLHYTSPQSASPNANTTTTTVTEQIIYSNTKTSETTTAEQVPSSITQTSESTTTEQNTKASKVPTTNQSSSFDYRTLGTIAAAFAGVIIYLVKSEENNRKNALQYTTDNRSDWMKYGRECTAQLIKNNEKFLNLIRRKRQYDKVKNKSDKYLDVYQKFMSELICSQTDIHQNITNLKLHYNFVGGRDNVLLKLLDIYREEILKATQNPPHSSRKQINYILNELLWHTQIYNKVEWERLKEEVSYVGNIDVRDQYIKLKMIDKREKYYFAQILQNWDMIKSDYPRYNQGLLNLSIITTYCKLIDAKTNDGVQKRLQNNLYKELQNLYGQEIDEFKKNLSSFKLDISSNPKFDSSDNLRNQLQDKIQSKIVPESLDTWPEFNAETQDTPNTEITTP